MNRIALSLWTSAALALGSPNLVLAQGLPKTQPKLITLIREEVKMGRNAEHAKHEAGWPAAYEKAKSPDYYLALTSLTGPNEAWYLVPSESHAAFGDSMKREDKDPVLSAELARLALGDAQYINGARVLQAVARTDLSAGSFPDVAKARFYEITVFHVHPGHEAQFEEAAKAYASARMRAEPKAGYRIYMVIAGMPGPAYLAFSSVEDYAGFDQTVAAAFATWKATTPDEKFLLQKCGAEGIISSEANRFRVDPLQSYVPTETREQDRDFWIPK